MQKLLHTIDNIVAGEKQYRETRDQILNQNAPDGKAAILLTESIAIQLSRANLRITALESKLAVLQEESQRLHGDTQEGKPHTTPNHASEDR